MDGFRRPPSGRSARPVSPVPNSVQSVMPPEIVESSRPSLTPQPIAPTPEPSKKPKKKWLLWGGLGVIGAILVAIASVLWWYTIQLAPVDSENTSKQVVVIEAGSTPSEIAQYLSEKGLIRSSTAFLWHARFEGVQNVLQAGTYRLSPSESTPEIVTHLSSGAVDTFSITFLPGATLADNRKVFIDAGYSEEEVDQALRQSYTSPLFEGKPVSADLEGYIYGETYSFAASTGVETILQHTFDEYYKVIEKHNLTERFKSQGLSLYEGIILASIIQKEAGSTPNDMAQISQVFHSRLAIDMPLGSDVTYQYIADKTGVPRDTNLDSPYNTRRYQGLPPGPVAAPGEKALVATAGPASGDYLYFLSGDDDITYFARTFEEHEANIANRCQKKCQIL